MSEIHFQSATLAGASLYQNQRLSSFSPTSSSSAALLAPLDNGEQCLATGSPEQLFNHNAHYTSDPAGSASLVQMQSDTAASITGEGGQLGWSESLRWGERTSRGIASAGELVPSLSRAGNRAGIIGNAMAIPNGIADAQKAWEEGNTAGVVRHGASTLSSVGQIYRDGGAAAIDRALSSEAYARFRSNRAAGTAFRQSVPGASGKVVSAASRQATAEALKGKLIKPASAAVTDAAKAAAKSTSGSIARGAGTVSRNAARVALREGGEAAAKAATRAVATSALKTGAKAAGRFVPGVNVGIAALDTAAAAATLADKDASIGKKVTSVITAAGSIVSATNIPIVSQVGAAVSTISSFIGSFF